MSAGHEGDRVDAFLDELLSRLTTEPARTRRILAECEDHLREAAAQAEAEGRTADEAQRAAIEAFGAPSTLARRFAAEQRRRLEPALLLDLALSLGRLVGVALLAIGISGLLAALAGASFGATFVAGDMPGVTYTEARCAQYFAMHPEAPGCLEAATAHHFDETVDYRVAAGVLGLLGLAALEVVRRMTGSWASGRRLPSGLLPAAGAATFGAAGGLLLLAGLGQLAFGPSDGVGANLTAGLVAAAVAAFYSMSLLRTLRTA